MAIGSGGRIWLTLLERPFSDESVGVLALRIALALAPALDVFTASPAQLKWPNDVYVRGKKLAGVLVEARWRGTRLDWLALGVGINVRVPQDLDVAGLRSGTDRVAVLTAIVPALRTASAKPGVLDRRRSDSSRPATSPWGIAVSRQSMESLLALHPTVLCSSMQQRPDVGICWITRPRLGYQPVRRFGMILVFDVGNTETTIGLFEAETLRGHWRIISGVERTADEFGVLLRGLLALDGFAAEGIDGAAIGSVVPASDRAIGRGLQSAQHGTGGRH